MSLEQQQQLVKLGRIGAPWGVKGHMRIQSYSTQEANIGEYTSWVVCQNGVKRSFELKDFQVHAKGPIAQLVGVETPEQAKMLTHADIFISRDALTPCEQGEYYWADLEGMEVLEQQGSIIGRLAYLYEIGDQHNMVIVRDQKEEIHIPFVLDLYVKQVSLEEKQIIVDWPLED